MEKNILNIMEKNILNNKKRKYIEQKEKEKEWFLSVLCVLFELGIILMLLIICLSVIISAFPFQVNLTDGTIIDLNSSDTTNNLTIIVIHQNYSQVFVNQTSINYTTINHTTINHTTINQTLYQNISNQSYFCINCTYYNSTNWSNNSEYLLKSEFVLYKDTLTYPYPSVSDFNNLVSDFNNLVDKVNAINVTSIVNDEDEGEKTHIYLWILSILGVLIGIVAIILAVKSGIE